MRTMMMKAHIRKCTDKCIIHILQAAILKGWDGMGWGYMVMPYRKRTWEIKIRARPRPNQTFSPDAKVYFVSLCSILLFRVVLLRWLSFWVCSQPRIDSHFLSFSGFHRSLIVCFAFSSLLRFCSLSLSLPFALLLHFARLFSSCLIFGVCVFVCGAQCERTHRSLLLCIILYTWIVYRLPAHNLLS